MALLENEWNPTRFERIAITGQNGAASPSELDVESPGCTRDLRARGQAHEVVRVRQFVRLVEVVDSPTQPAIGVAPGAKVLDVEIAHGQHARRVRILRTSLRPESRPAVIRAAKERKRIVRVE